MPETMTTIDITDPAFARRLARLLISARETRNVSIRQLARASLGRFTQAKLMELESAGSDLTDELVESVAMLYMADLGKILPAREPVVVQGRSIAGGGLSLRFDPEDESSLLESYLQLVRLLRRERMASDMALRRDDIQLLAAYLRQPTDVVLHRLAARMGATRTERLTMLGLFGNGAIVVGLAGARAS